MMTARHAEPALRSLGQLRARLEYADLDDLITNLNEEMSVVQDVTTQVSIAVSTSYFAADGAARLDYRGDALRCG
jgi:hypothetical protein